MPHHQKWYSHRYGSLILTGSVLSTVSTGLMVTLYRIGRRIEQCEEKVGIRVGGISRDVPYTLHNPIVFFFRVRPASAS